MTSVTAPVTPARVTGLDVARAVAVLGMVAAHVGNDDPAAGGMRVLAISHGLPSAAFAVLAGVSMTLMLTGRGAIPLGAVTAERLTHTRVRIAVRGALLIVLGYLLTGLNTPVDVILANLGLMFLIATVALRWRTWVLLATAVPFIAVGGWVAVSVSDALGVWADIPVLEKLWSYHYPALAWMGYILIGLVLGRLPLARPRIAGWLLLAGAAIGVPVMLGGRVLEDAFPGNSWLSMEPHSYSPPEMIGNAAVAAALIGVSVLLARWLRWLLWPLAALGSMALTAYTAHLIVIAVVGSEMVYEPSNVAYAALALGLIAGCSLWRAFLGQGPLERLLSGASTRFADQLTAAPASSAPPS